jgi:hypothetical protein
VLVGAVGGVLGGVFGRGPANINKMGRQKVGGEGAVGLCWWGLLMGCWEESLGGAQPTLTRWDARRRGEDGVG